MRKNKELGQVFLKNPKYVHQILRAMDLAGRNVLEIGPGGGVMTGELLERCGHLWCVEIDRRFAELLEKEFSGHSGFTLLNKDILGLDLGKIGKELLVFGNVPYNISYQLITYIIEQRDFISEVFMTFQKEFAYKLAAGPGDKDYSFLSCYFQCFCMGRVLFDIPKESFSPRPKVDSAFIKINFREKPLCLPEEEGPLMKLIKRAFSQRRKKIINSLGASYPKKTVHAMCACAGVSPDSRAENVSVEQYLEMLSFLKESKAANKDVPGGRE